jgi:hypothetical protein
MAATGISAHQIQAAEPLSTVAAAAAVLRHHAVRKFPGGTSHAACGSSAHHGFPAVEAADVTFPWLLAVTA